MSLGLGVLKLEPRVFWSMTLREIEVVLNAYLGRGQIFRPPTREQLSALMTIYPDTKR